MKIILATDIETYSSNDLLKGGVYKYVEAEDFQILFMSYWINGIKQPRLDLTRQAIPAHVVALLLNDDVEKNAFNAPFERICFSRHLGFDVWKGKYINPKSWKCTRVSAARAGYPLSLKAAASAIGGFEGKMEAGTTLINLFSKPCKPTKTNGQRTRNMRIHFPEKWELFGEYCDQDVYVEQEVKKHTDYLPVIEMEERLWLLDQQINDRGVAMNVKMIVNALKIHADYVDEIYDEAADLTGLSNPNSRKQLLEWLIENGAEVEDLKKATVTDLLKDMVDGDIRRVLLIRQEMAKTSVKKYAAMRHVCGKDHRARGLFQYYGANRTGRWAGRLIQMQNLTKHYMKDVDLARWIVDQGDGQALQWCYGNVPDTLSQLIRTMFTASEGNILTVVDYSAIEARILSWLAGEKWRMQVFEGDGKIYEASAAKMFRIAIETIIEGHDNYAYRAKGKVAELALGYQGAVNALLAMGALAMGVKERELPVIVKLWRAENPEIVKLWYAADRAAIQAMQNPGRNIPFVKGISFFFKRRNLYIKLPSGRMLCYVNAKLGHNRFGKTAVHYEGLNQKTKKWGSLDVYGGKFIENITQAIARDCLGVGMIRVDDAGYAIVGHVHDEIIIDHKADVLEEVEEMLGLPIPWAPGLILRAEGFTSPYYKK